MDLFPFFLSCDTVHDRCVDGHTALSYLISNRGYCSEEALQLLVDSGASAEQI